LNNTSAKQQKTGGMETETDSDLSRGIAFTPNLKAATPMRQIHNPRPPGLLNEKIGASFWKLSKCNALSYSSGVQNPRISHPHPVKRKTNEYFNC